MGFTANLLLLLALAAPVASLHQHETASSVTNPIRKVVTMLQSMQAKVTEEGKKEKELYGKFMCYCKTSGGTLSASIAEGKNKIASLETGLKESGETKAQTEQDLKDHTASRDEAKAAMAEATAIREKEAAAFAKEKSDYEANIAALAKAIAALETGVMGGFLQTSAAVTLKRFMMEKADLTDGTRQEMLAFLSGTQTEGYVPQSGEIIGILKQLKDEMSAGLADAIATENSAIASYQGLMAAKKKEVATLQQQIETEMLRLGDLGVQLASMANDLEDTQESLAADTKFLAGLESGCDAKTKLWEEISATRAEELLALAETIKVLNDDDALELFKKTLPSASASFVQMKRSTADMKTRALAALRRVARSQSAMPARPEIDLIELALNGKQQGFEKVIAMIDNLVALLKKEQTDDDSKKDYCSSEFDSSDDKKKGLEQSISDSQKAIDDMEGSIATLKEEIAALEAGIKALDKSVADATAQRKAENSAYSEVMSDDANAKEVLGWAKNRLYKFYEPKMYKPPPATVLSDQEDITVRMGGTASPTPAPSGIANLGIGAAFVQISAYDQNNVVPPPPPESFDGYTAKTEKSTGVITMIDLLIKDLDKEMAESEVDEKDAQKEYEALMADAAAKRAGDSKSITDKESGKAAAEEALQAETAAKIGSGKELVATLEYIQGLHGECDWLMKYFDVRKAARTSEIEALGNAKAVLSGADYALVQTSRTGLRR